VEPEQSDGQQFKAPRARHDHSIGDQEDRIRIIEYFSGAGRADQLGRGRHPKENRSRFEKQIFVCSFHNLLIKSGKRLGFGDLENRLLIDSVAVRHHEQSDRLLNPKSSGSEARGAACIRNIAATAVRTAGSARIVDEDKIVGVGAIVIDFYVNVPARVVDVPTQGGIPLRSVVTLDIARFPARSHNRYQGRGGASGWIPSPASVKVRADRGTGRGAGKVAGVC